MSAPAAGSGDFLSRLKDQTRAEHEAIETALGLVLLCRYNLSSFFSRGKILRER